MRGALKRTVFLAVLMLVGMAASLTATYSLWEKRWVMFCAFLILNMVTLGASLRVAGIDSGTPELSCEQHTAEAIKAMPSLLIIGLVDFVNHEPLLEFPILIAQLSCHIGTGLNVRGAGLLVLSFSFVLNITLTFAGVFANQEWLPICCSAAFCTALGFWTKYFHDQRLVFCLGHIQVAGGVLCYQFMLASTDIAENILWPFLVVLMIYLILLFHRRLRRLPRVLDAMRFIRLGFIRGDAACSGRLQRFQEMPVGAFGDVGKAMVLIPISHRWLNRGACDVPTAAFPMGLRLGTMRQKLARHFGPTRAEMPSFARRLRHALRRRPVGGWDAVVFFDFCCMPQVPRSEDEERTFRLCLPHMGILYSMFPTMVLHEVTPEVHGYLESGWCYCEFQIAMLGKQLSPYSCDALEAIGHSAAAGRGVRDEDNMGATNTLEGFVSEVDAEVGHKHFFKPGDLDDVRCIVTAFALKRMMLDAIEAGDTEQLCTVVDSLETQGLLHTTMDQPVNKALETPLHVAVRNANAAATKLLLDKGASPVRRNLRGDVPAQCFLLPRWSSAARLARVAGASRQWPSDRPPRPSAPLPGAGEDAEWQEVIQCSV